MFIYIYIYSGEIIVVSETVITVVRNFTACVLLASFSFNMFHSFWDVNRNEIKPSFLFLNF